MGRLLETKLLLELGADVNARNYYGNSPLHIATETNQIKFIRILPTNQARPNIQNSKGITALHDALQYGNEQILKLFVRHNAYIYITQGLTALRYASKNANASSLLEFLLHFERFDVNCKDRNGLLPLDYSLAEHHCHNIATYISRMSPTTYRTNNAIEKL